MATCCPMRIWLQMVSKCVGPTTFGEEPCNQEVAVQLTLCLLMEVCMYLYLSLISFRDCCNVCLPALCTYLYCTQILPVPSRSEFLLYYATVHIPSTRQIDHWRQAYFTTVIMLEWQLWYKHKLAAHQVSLWWLEPFLDLYSAPVCNT